MTPGGTWIAADLDGEVYTTICNLSDKALDEIRLIVAQKVRQVIREELARFATPPVNAQPEPVVNDPVRKEDNSG
jgi:hypothetical protein